MNKKIIVLKIIFGIK